jgi:hypothetical protein
MGRSPMMETRVTPTRTAGVDVQFVAGHQFDESQRGEGEADDHEPRSGLGAEVGSSLGHDDEQCDEDHGGDDARDGAGDVPPVDRMLVEQDHHEEEGDGDRLGDDARDENIADLTLGGVSALGLHGRVIGPGPSLLYPRRRLAPIG